jgi:hypothetical protein
MRTCWVQFSRLGPVACGMVLLAAGFLSPTLFAQDAKPMGAPLVLSSIETEQEVPLAIILPDGKTAKCVTIRLHWISKPDVGPNEDAASFTLDLPDDNPAAPIFIAQLWNASLASALAWQEPWEGARWKVLQTPVTDGTGLDAAMAVGMIATSARRPYPPKTVVIGHLNPDGSLGPVSHLLERIDAAAQAGMTRVIIPSVQRFDTDEAGQVVNIVRHATELNLECVPVDDLVAATQTTMNDPLPDATLSASIPRYSDDVASYIDLFAHHEQTELSAGLKFAPKETELSTYPPRLSAIWKGIYADYEAGQQAYRAGQVYTAYHLFCRANGHMNGANALAGQTRASFDVKTALDESDDLHDRLHSLMNPPAIDQGGLESAVLVAEMADWAYGIDASLEGAQLVTRQAFSMRSDATDAEKDRAREAILFSNAQSKYLLTQVNFYTGLLSHLSKENPGTAEENAEHLLPQLIPAQLATARSFTEGIRASDLRDGLLFDSRLVAYVNVLRQTKADWDSRKRRKDILGQADAKPPAKEATPAAPGAGSVKLNANAPDSAVGFDPGDTYKPPHTIVALADTAKKLSDVALCLIWVNHDCEIAALDEKYLRLSGAMDPATHEWHMKDRGRLDSLLQMAEIGARHGIAFAEKAEIDPSVLAMIYERATHERQGNDASALDALRNYWRCALLGNVCWQLSHTPKAQPVDLSALSSEKDDKSAKKGDKKGDAGTTKKESDQAQTVEASASTNTVVVVPADNSPATTNEVVTPNAIATTTNTVEQQKPPEEPVAPPTPAPISPPATVIQMVKNPPITPIAPIAHDDESNIPVAPIATNMGDNPAPPTPAPDAGTPATNAAPAPQPPSTPVAGDPSEMNIPVAPIAKATDYAQVPPSPSTNLAPVSAVPPATKGDASGSFP